jgi:hypothetical protein
VVDRLTSLVYFGGLMKLKAMVFTAIVLSFLAGSALAQLNLNSRHPDESPSYTFNQRFSSENALKTLKRIESYLQSFRTLTDTYKKRFTKAELAKVGNTDWENQGLGFYNGTRAIEGSIRKQEYQLRQLEYELAQLKYEGRQMSSDELNEKKIAFEKAEKEFQAFWDSFSIRD